MLNDSFGRLHNYLRISLTDNCNLRCSYCMPEEEYKFMPNAQLMQADEIFTIAKTFVALGVNKIRLTGGEPLVRKDAAKIIRTLGSLPVELAITTNGTRLHEFLPTLLNAGITSINVSLDTLQQEKFHLITKRDQFAQVKNNIDLLLQNNIHPKINVVVMKGINEHEILDFIEWTKATPIHIRFIEFMPFSGNKWISNKVITWQQILETIESRYDFIPLKSEANATAKKYKVLNHEGTFAIISTMSQPFCSTCNRMRLTADGKMKNCLFSQDETDILSALRQGKDIIPLIQQNISDKKEAQGGQFVPDFEQLHADTLHNRSMIAIGG